MKKFQPPTILHLTLIGFVVVLMPLLLGTIRGFQSLDRMATQHETDMSSIVLLTESTRTIQGNLEDMERSARQYQLLGDPSIRDMFNERYKAAQNALADITLISRGEKLVPIARILLQELEKLEQGINQVDDKDPAFNKELARFERLFFLVQTLNQEGSLFLNERVKDAQGSVEEVSQELVLYVVTLLPLTVALVFLFTSLILKPLRQIDTAIRKLGQGEYDGEFTVQGPVDLQRVAQRLSWLGRQLSESEEEKKRFLRHISHELKTPLSTIKEGIELLEDQIPGKLNEAQQEVVGILSSAATSFQSLINNLLDFNLLRRDPNLHTDVFDMEEIVQDTVNAHKLTAKRKKISLKVEGQALQVRADRSVLRAALDNLVSNAVHYTPKGGYIEINWSPEGQENLVFQVLDSGPGIPQEERHKVFLPFYQGTARKQGPLKGTGLGLSVAKECVESHGGQLQIIDSLIGAHMRVDIPHVIANKELS
ncbi:HAMP domain-containing sensor histidine kinase [Pseudobacteriovorax antillogorgiicola]|uniref:histidine kinase n=1 Tax=Pseudobacteriovorax antillogorgiicola TaxID=1513793 RepID=A0A1Y6BYR6_9BACT|nr:HAMP domain-containing sensor histidine kinase [Pseudobacteriovorax antillogorgiicola]TCS51270.1 two-component system sensor histidine kinase GlrK [Pseudobacteriovorax antillogorgiicola]SMF36369.1 two-component system, NtrC family, sensor histidine kinase GlrK [Pseudobacteriovorax antillogorgiicola]